MKPVSPVLISVLLLSLHLNVSGQHTLFPIKEHGLWGYTDSTGEIVIKPQFKSAGLFSEGLAPVRVDGTYGFINTQGKMVIKPKYDFVATPFSFGTAAVFTNKHRFFITRQGTEISLERVKSIMRQSGKGPFITSTRTGKYQLINRAGEAVTDTVFSEITYQGINSAMVYGLNTHNSKTDGLPEIGLMDSTGKWIVPYGRYKDISVFNDNYALATLITPSTVSNGETNAQACIDKSGKQYFIIPDDQYFFDHDKILFTENVAVVNIYLTASESMKDPLATHIATYKGLINTEGRVILSKPTWQAMTPVSHNRLFVFDSDTEKWTMIDKTGKLMCDSAFERIAYTGQDFDTYGAPFKDGIAYVKLFRGWVAVDTSGRFMTAPVLFCSHDAEQEVRKFGDFLLLYDGTEYGFYNAKTQSYVKPIYKKMNFSYLRNGVLLGEKEDESLDYLTTNGKIIWQQPKEKDGELCPNRDNISVSTYTVSKELMKDASVLGNRSDQNATQMKKSLAIILSRPKKKQSGMDLYIVNNTADTVCLDAEDNRIYLVLQALDKDKVWTDIERYEHSFCGNSYFPVSLPPGKSWSLKASCYQGVFKTRLRAKLFLKKNEKDVVYSNEVAGYVNPGQLYIIYSHPSIIDN